MEPDPNVSHSKEKIIPDRSIECSEIKLKSQFSKQLQPPAFIKRF
jgi:hypothetical protein